MNRKLTVILRTCSPVYVLHGSRYVEKSKHEIINVCASSLVNSINQVKNHHIELVVIDDHSSDECLKDIKTILSKCKFPTRLEHRSVSGNGPSMEHVYDIVENRVDDLWYHIEDDYLHKPEAIQDMIDSLSLFEENTEQMVAINPHDDVHRYKYQIYPSIILLGPSRHYRTVEHSTYSCMASKKLYMTHKRYFTELVRLTTAKADYVEDQTINRVWLEEGVKLFSPIPGLAFHISTPDSADPYLDFQQLWNSTPELWK